MTQDIRILVHGMSTDKRRFSNPTYAILAAQQMVRESGVLEFGEWEYNMVEVVRGNGDGCSGSAYQYYWERLWHFSHQRDLDTPEENG